MSSSDDDIASLLPAGRGGRGAAAPPRRLRNFKAMLSDSSSDEEDGKKAKTSVAAPPAPQPAPKSKVPPSAAPVAAVSPSKEKSSSSDDDDDDDASKSDSIQFQEDEGERDVTADVSMDIESDHPPSRPATPPSVKKQPLVSLREVASPPPPPSLPPAKTTEEPNPARSQELGNRTTSRQAPPTVGLQRQEQEPEFSPPRTAPQLISTPRERPPSPGSAPRQWTNDEEDYLKEVLPLHPNTKVISQSVPPTTQRFATPPPVGEMRTASATRASTRSPSIVNPSSPMRVHSDPLDDLLVRAQQRLKDKERLDSALQVPTTVRTASPLRALGNDTGSRRSASFSGELVTPDTAREIRLQKENNRLAQELAFLTKENQRLRGSDSLNAANEVTKLQVHVELLKQQLREQELDTQRTKAYFDSQAEDNAAHVKDLTEELKSVNATRSQFDSVVREKDTRLAELQAQLTKLQAQQQDRTSEVRRIEEEAKRQREDDRTRIERANALFEDVKRQRVQLQELNDKFLRDKELAVAERKRVADELKAVQSELQHERERKNSELGSLRDEVEKYRSLLQEKERTFATQIAEERRAKEYFQHQMEEFEESATKEAQKAQAAYRSQQEESRKQIDELSKLTHAYADQLKVLTAQLEEAKADINTRIQREKSANVKELTDRLTQMKEQRDASEDKRRVAEDQLKRALAERDHYRQEADTASEISAQWQRAKDKAETQCTQLSVSLQQLMEQDEQLVHDNHNLRAEVEQAFADMAGMKVDLDQLYRVEQQLQDLSLENDRISEECTRVTAERNELIQENAKMADEMVKWRNEVREMFSNQRRQVNLQSTSAKAFERPNNARYMSRNDFSF